MITNKLNKTCFKTR